jgi:hypothetical protein
MKKIRKKLQAKRKQRENKQERAEVIGPFVMELKSLQRLSNSAIMLNSGIEH